MGPLEGRQGDGALTLDGTPDRLVFESSLSPLLTGAVETPARYLGK
jgi:hypothetical protein